MIFDLLPVCGSFTDTSCVTYLLYPVSWILVICMHLVILFSLQATCLAWPEPTWMGVWGKLAPPLKGICEPSSLLPYIYMRLLVGVYGVCNRGLASLWTRTTICMAGWCMQPVSASWGLNIEHSFGGKLTHLIHCMRRLRSECCLPNNRVRGLGSNIYRMIFDNLAHAKTPITSNADQSPKMRLGNGCLLWFWLCTPIQHSWDSIYTSVCLIFHGGMGCC